MRFFKQHLLNIIFVSLVITFWGIANYKFNPKPEPEIVISELDELQKKSSEIIIEMNKLMTSLATLIIGALGAFIIKRYETLKIKATFPRILVAASSMLAIFSIYFGYVLYIKMVEMLSNNFYNPNNSLIEMPRKYQYYCLWLSAILFVVFVLAETAPHTHEQKSETSGVEVNPSNREQAEEVVENAAKD
jgi:hypothetical protein